MDHIKIVVISLGGDVGKLRSKDRDRARRLGKPPSRRRVNSEDRPKLRTWTRRKQFSSLLLQPTLLHKIPPTWIIWPTSPFWILFETFHYSIRNPIFASVTCVPAVEWPAQTLTFQNVPNSSKLSFHHVYSSLLPNPRDDDSLIHFTVLREPRLSMNAL